MVKDDLLRSLPRPLFPDIFHDYSTYVPSFENSSLDVSTSNHSQNTWDVSLSFDCREYKSFFPNSPNLSSFISGNIEGENSCFSLPPLYDSSNHEDAIVHLKFSDHGCLNIFTHSSDHDSNSPTVDLSKPPVFDDPSSDEVETPQVIEAL